MKGTGGYSLTEHKQECKFHQIKWLRLVSRDKGPRSACLYLSIHGRVPIAVIQDKVGGSNQI